MKTDGQFRRDIAIGNAWEAKLYRELSAFIHGLTEPEQAQVVNGMVAGGFGYDPDMQVLVSLEAKVRLDTRFDFTNASDFPYRSIIVNEVYKTHQDNITTEDYLALPVHRQLTLMKPFHSYWVGNYSQTHVAVISPATKPVWFQQRVYSPKDRRDALNWCCPIVMPDGRPVVQFGKFPDDIPKLLTRL
jgi:hypothetical protein